METETQKLDAQPSAIDSMKPDIQIPGYTILRELGHGGMAYVYLAVQESFGREVALKILSPQLANDEQFSKRFLREAQIVSQLNHPNIVTVYDAGKQGKYHYMSMEYIPGKDLKQLKDSISRKEAIRIVKDVARALDFAGEKGVVHRDVKPENIMIHESDNRVILMDFGIAHGDDVTHGMTQTGKAIGTPHFMSPEQTKGLKVDHRSDIYSLGIVLYQMLASHLPFDASSAVAVGIKHLTAPIPLLPTGLEIFQPIVNKCLSKQPEHRYQKAAQLIAALDKISGEQISNIATKAAVFRQAGTNHNAETQLTGAVKSQRKMPDLVFPSSNNKITSEQQQKPGTRRRNLLLLLLISTMAWAANEKQKELTQFWGYKALPEIAKMFPELFPESYIQYWANLKETKSSKIKTNITPAPALNNNPATTEQAQNAETLADAEVTPNAAIATQAAPQIKEEPDNKDKITLLKENLDNKPENAIELAALYKEILFQTKADPEARKGLKELREWNIQQIRLAFATEDAGRARQHINIMKESFPRAAKNKRFIRLERKVAFLERLDTHFLKAEKYFNAGALSKPVNQNALDEINKVLRLSPENQDAKKFITKIVNSYMEKTTQLQKQGNLHNAVLMVEEGIAALNDPQLVNKRTELKNLAKHNKKITALLKQAKKYQAAGHLIKPRAYNAYHLYQDVLKKENDNLEAKAGIKTLHQLVAKDILHLIQKGDLESANIYLQEAKRRYGRSSLLANVQLKLNDAFDLLAPKIETLKLSSSPVKDLITHSPLNQADVLHLKRTLYIGFNFINFEPKATWLDVIIFDNERKTKIVQKPIVISQQFGEHFFDITLATSEFHSGNYKLELKLNNKTLSSKSFTVRNN